MDRIITYAEAIREALSQEMRRDGSVFLMGEDIGVYGGSFGVTSGMIEEFGPERIRETPISETAYMGAGVGAAMMGMRPVVELMFSDFAAVCWDQIINEAAKMHFMSGGRTSVPMVIRGASGGGTGAAEQHSQALENLYCHIPGLKVVIPSTPYDAKGLLVSAIRDDNPVVFLEQKLLYGEKGSVPEEEYTIEFGKADIKRAGDDVTIVTYGRMVQVCLEAAQKLEQSGVDAEVIDLRTLVPFDRETVLASVGKTGRAVIVHEAVKSSGFGAEIAASIAESEVIKTMRAPIKRVCGKDTPVPFSKPLEEDMYPTAARIAAAALETMR